MKSFSILRTNVGLTTNVKVVCDTNYNLYLESIDSAPELSISRLKKMQFNKNNFFDELVPYFFKDFPSDIAYQIAYYEDNDNMSQDFASQYDDTYCMGAKNIIDNKNYKEEFEYFAPLYVFKAQVPKFFIIFRVDGPGLDDLSSTNFRVDFLNKFKTVKLFDLTNKTPVGEWIDRNFRNNISFPNSSLEIDFRNLEFSKWIGIDYETGGFTYKSSFLENSLENENTIFDFERFFFDGFKVNKLIYPQIVNFSFLFDDTPATPNSLRKWSLNRYAGFYLDDLELIDTITPFKMRNLKEDVQILEKNELYSPSGDPFVLGFLPDQDNWVEYRGNFYKVERYSETKTRTLSNRISKNAPKRTLEKTVKKIDVSKSLKSETIKIEEFRDVQVTKYRIISDIELLGKQEQLNRNTYLVDPQGLIFNIDGSSYSIANFSDSDVNVIEIDGMFHNLLLDESGTLKINSDYGFNWLENYRFEYFINSPNTEYYKFMDLEIRNDNSPKSFKIYRANFTEIKDFDTSIVDTEFSKFEYEKVTSVTETEEPKMYTTDFRINTNPAPFNDYFYKNEVYNIPCSSDYTANLETFRIVNDDLTELWRMNPVHCRFGLQGSISASDQPYLLNNNEIHGNFNRTCDTFDSIPNRRSRNLDYFYTINSGRANYLYHSLHVEKNFESSQDSSFRFELDKYLNLKVLGTSSINEIDVDSLDTSTFSINYYNYDYFRYFFGFTQSLLSGQILKKTNKWSLFDRGDSANPNTTVFRGLKFKIFEVEKIKKGKISIEDINLNTSNEFEDYKFSILLSQNTQNLSLTGSLYQTSNYGEFTAIYCTSSGGNDYVAFKTSDTVEPDNLTVGSRITIRQNYPKLDKSYEGLATVIYVGQLHYGGYGFIVNKPFISTTKIVEEIIGNGSTLTIELGYSRNSGPNTVLSLKSTGHGITNPELRYITHLNTDSGPATEWIGQNLLFTPFGTDYLTHIKEGNLPEKDFVSGTVSNIGLSQSTIKSPTSSLTTGYYTSNFEWKLINNWELETEYKVNDYVFYDDVIYRVIADNVVTDPNEDPADLSDFYLATSAKQPFWSPRATYNTGDWCYRQGQYYKRTSEITGVDFYNTTTSYSTDQIMIWKGDYYISKKENRKITPKKSKRIDTISEDFELHWRKIPPINEWFANPEFNNISVPVNIWEPIAEWNSSSSYIEDELVSWDGNLWKANQDITPVIEEDGDSSTVDYGGNPEDNQFWTRVYSFRMDSELKYSPVENPVIQIGESYYLCTFSSGLTLDNGISIYINKKWKNILVNIAINDSTTFDIDNAPRDLLYKDFNSRLTAASFIRQFNDLDTKYDFADYTSYVIIDEKGKVTKYNFDSNLETLPYFILCEEPDEFELKNQTLNYIPENIPSTVLKATRVLVNGKIENLTRINYYNEIPIAYQIERNRDEQKFGKNYNGRFNITVSKDASKKPKSNIVLSETFYRHSGNYMPVFYDLQLFRPPAELDTTTGNYKFAEELSFFGIMKQRIISKINRKENILKLRNSRDRKSIYPMLDEFGYSYKDFFIFKSTWDFFYHVECELPKFNEINPENKLFSDRLRSEEKIENRR